MHEEAIAALDARLPARWISKVANRLADQGQVFSSATISRVKNRQFENKLVMDTILEVAAEEDERRAHLAARMRGEHTPTP